MNLKHTRRVGVALLGVLLVEVSCRLTIGSLAWRVLSLSVLVPGPCHDSFVTAAAVVQRGAPSRTSSPTSDPEEDGALRTFGVVLRSFDGERCEFVFRHLDEDRNRFWPHRVDGGPLVVIVDRVHGEVVSVSPVRTFFGRW